MNEEILINIGLNPTQAKAYLTLVRYGSLTPPELANKTGETRSNAYTVLDRLVELGLAKKLEANKKLVYRIENPVALEKLVKQHRDDALQREKLVKDSMPALLNFFYTYSEQPGIRFFQGKQGIEDIYNDQIRTGKEIEFVRSTSDVKLYDYETMRKLRGKFAKMNIPRHSFSPDAPDIPTNWREVDPIRKLKRTWMRTDDYTAPVEWGVYGNKVSIISFGEEAIGMIIESPQIAEAMRQILKLMDEGLRSRPDYTKLPTKARVTVTGSLEIGKGTHVFKGKPLS
jgi:sugar-specific transcriptional regulator TrmB